MPATKPALTGEGTNLMNPASRSEPASSTMIPVNTTASDIAAQTSQMLPLPALPALRLTRSAPSAA